MFHADEWTNIRTDVMELTGTFRNFAIAPKIEWLFSIIETNKAERRYIKKKKYQNKCSVRNTKFEM